MPQEVHPRVTQNNHIFQHQATTPVKTCHKPKDCCGKGLPPSRRGWEPAQPVSPSMFLVGLVAGWARPFQGIQLAAKD